jgi:hypothetical protein
MIKVLCYKPEGRSVRIEVFTVVAMKNVVYCGIKIQFVPHMKHIISPLQSPAG